MMDHIIIPFNFNNLIIASVYNYNMILRNAMQVKAIVSHNRLLINTI